jgi:predicted phosphodiesterase
MRVAALYDIHGNLPALEAVLDEVRRAHVDRIVVGGDVVVGPMSRDAVQRLLELDTPVDFIQGNCEVAVLADMAGGDPGPLPEQARAAIHDTARQFDPDGQRLMASWPKTFRLDIPALGDVFFCHATPRNENECFTRLTPEDRLAPLFDPLNVAVAVCGHTHMQFDRMVGKTRVVNAGSVGMPFGEPGADWLLLGPDVQLRHTPYDLADAAARIRRADYPQAEEFVSRYLLKPPPEEEMLALFTRAQLA